LVLVLLDERLTLVRAAVPVSEDEELSASDDDDVDW
jgi:hypothetical protein